MLSVSELSLSPKAASMGPLIGEAGTIKAYQRLDEDRVVDKCCIREDGEVGRFMRFVCLELGKIAALYPMADSNLKNKIFVLRRAIYASRGDSIGTFNFYLCCSLSSPQSCHYSLSFTIQLRSTLEAL